MPDHATHAHPQRALRLGVAGPVGTGKSSLIALLCKELGQRLSVAVITNDIYTDEDARLLRSAGVLAPERIRAVETGACPHTAIRDDVTQNLLAVEDLERDFDPVDLVLVESGGDNLTATFSPALVDAQFFVLDVAGGGDVARKGGPGIARADVLIVNKTDLAPVRGGRRGPDGGRRRAGPGRSNGDRPVPQRPDLREPPQRVGAGHAGQLPHRRLGARRSRPDGAALSRRRHGARALSLTRITVDGDRVGLRHGQLRAQRLGDRGGWVRIGLLATTAVLLGGDEVEIEVSVGEGMRLDLFDIAGTVAYHGRGRPAAWHVRIELADGAELRYRGEPFVVADGADVQRTLRVELADTAGLRLRETLILGRAGELGGRLRSETRLRIADLDVWVEDQLLDPDGDRRRPGMLGDRRVLDSMIMVGTETVAAPTGAVGYALVDGRGSVIRYLGTDLAASPVPQLWRPEADDSATGCD